MAPRPFCRTCGFYYDGPCQRWSARDGACTGRPDCRCGHGYHQGSDSPPKDGYEAIGVTPEARAEAAWDVNHYPVPDGWGFTWQTRTGA